MEAVEDMTTGGTNRGGKQIYSRSSRLVVIGRRTMDVGSDTDEYQPLPKRTVHVVHV